MSRSGNRYRDPFNTEARKRKAAPIEPERKQRLEELRQQELDDELQNMWHEAEWRTGKEEFENFMREREDD